MSSQFTSAPSGPYTHAYRHSNEFPQAALERIPAGLVGAIDSGNAEFFADLANEFPKTYSALVNQCPAVQLLEMVVERETRYGEQKEDRLYNWGCICAGKLLKIDIPHYEAQDPLRIEDNAIYLSAIPQAFAAFYQQTDGMAITTSMSMIGFDLPNAFSEWQSLTDYYDARDLKPADAEKLSGILAGDDTRVFLTARNGDFVVVSLDISSRDLYLVRRAMADAAVPINDPVPVLDNYFAKAILAKEDTIPFLA